MIDLAIRNGWLIDGTGGVRHRADIGIQGKQVVEIGRVSTASACTTRRACES
jgi:N-acyl-D-aspartate/D-glutamate deacylase